MKIVWDLDGVIRDLSKAVVARYCPGFTVKTWYWDYNGKNIYDFINMDLKILEDCPPTEYYDVIRRNTDLVIWTRQPDNWIYGTMRWVQKYLPQASVRIFGPDQSKDDAIKNECDFIVEDYPLFKDYSKVLLIDRPYNQEAETDKRVSEPAGLEAWLKWHGVKLS